MKTLELNIDLDVSYYLENSNATSYEELYDYIVDSNGFDVEIVYYASAIQYLKENDPSLQESLSIADEYGFNPSSLNSEVLASLLASRNLRDDFEECKEEIEEYFNSL